MKLKTSKCKKGLAAMWFPGAAIIILILVIQSVLGKHGDHTQAVWEWFLPNIIPTLGLIAGVLTFDALGRTDPHEYVDGFLFWLTFGVSGFYLLLVALPVVASPFVASAASNPPAFLKTSNLWLGPLQGLVAVFLGIFFVKRPQGQDD